MFWRLIFSGAGAMAALVAAGDEVPVCLSAAPDKLYYKSWAPRLPKDPAARVQVRNQCETSFRQINVRCTFYDGDREIDNSVNAVYRLPAGASQSVHVVLDAPGARFTTAQCRIDFAH